MMPEDKGWSLPPEGTVALLSSHSTALKGLGPQLPHCSPIVQALRSLHPTIAKEAPKKVTVAKTSHFLFTPHIGF